MIERVYIDNYRCLLNCEVKLGSVALLLGQNGTGKSSVFDVISAIQQFAVGEKMAGQAFSAIDLAQSINSRRQDFALDIRLPSGLYRYALETEYSEDKRACLVLSEKLTLDDKDLYWLENQRLHTFTDDHAPGPIVKYQYSRSALEFISSESSQKVGAFKDYLKAIILVRPCPPMMISDSQVETDTLDVTAANFASWYRYVARQDINRQLELFTELKQALDGFESLRLEGPADTTLTMRVVFREAKEAKPIVVKLGALSDGQRQLLLLNTLLFGLSNVNRTLILDEPDNYLSLREIQPWLTAMSDAVGRSLRQVLLISHHPEVIDYLAPDHGIWFACDDAGRTQVQYGRAADTAPLRPSEVEARGW